MWNMEIQQYLMEYTYTPIKSQTNYIENINEYKEVKPVCVYFMLSETVQTLKNALYFQYFYSEGNHPALLSNFSLLVSVYKTIKQTSQNVLHQHDVEYQYIYIYKSTKKNTSRMILKISGHQFPRFNCVTFVNSGTSIAYNAT